MKNLPVFETRHDVVVAINKDMDELRKSECLCLNCDNMKPGPDNCVIAAQLYQICLKTNVAMAITRCPVWQPKS